MAPRQRGDLPAAHAAGSQERSATGPESHTGIAGLHQSRIAQRPLSCPPEAAVPT